MRNARPEIDPQSPETWPADFDALIAAPRHHTLLIENERVRVLRTLIPPGETTAVHTHPSPSVIHTLSFSHYLRRDGSGTVIQDTRTSDTPRPEFVWSPPLPPHSIENVGNADIHLILVEVKTAPRT
jgi:quercetin dioxygenase-like cupin family protein